MHQEGENCTYLCAAASQKLRSSVQTKGQCGLELSDAEIFAMILRLCVFIEMIVVKGYYSGSIPKRARVHRPRLIWHMLFNTRGTQLFL